MTTAEEEDESTASNGIVHPTIPVGENAATTTTTTTPTTTTNNRTTPTPPNKAILASYKRQQKKRQELLTSLSNTLPSPSLLRVLPSESEHGPVEYKRQISTHPTPTRLRTLATQMSFRLDEGRGRATYHVGVEDDGKHSLLDYQTVYSSVNVLEALARSLNSIVIRKKFIQGEFELVQDPPHTEEEDVGGGGEEEEAVTSRSGVQLVRLEIGSRIAAKLKKKKDCVSSDDGETMAEEEAEEEEEKEEKTSGLIESHEGAYSAEDYFFDDEDGTGADEPPVDESPTVLTRCSLTIQRVETHLIDPSPTSLAMIAEAATAGGGDTTRRSRMVHSSSEVNVSSADAASSSATAAATGGGGGGGGGGGKGVPERDDAGDDNTTTPEQGGGGAVKKDVPPPPHTSPITTAELAKAAAAATTSISPSSSYDNDPTSSSPDHPTAKHNTLSDTLSRRNIRIAVVGNVDAGKSTLIGTLTTSSLDDGRGKSRTAIMKHRHEIESGRTSTSSTHLLGFRPSGEAIHGSDKIRAPHKLKSEDEIARESHRVITLMDLAGHEKYLKTTIHGVSSGFADYALILVNARHLPTHMTKHHVNLCCSFGIPLIVVFTKCDGCPEHALKTSKMEVVRMLKAPDVGKRPYNVRNETDVTTCLDKMHALCPMIETSCVTGEGLELLRSLLFQLPKRRKHEKKIARHFEFLVEDIFNVPGVGSVVSGFVNAGELTLEAGVGGHSSCHVFVGPTNDGTYMKTIAKSAHIARINTTHITAGQSACLALALKGEAKKRLRKGMVVLTKDGPPISTREFDAEICVLKGEGTTIRKSYQAYVHILNVRQSAYAKSIELMKTGGVSDSSGPVMLPPVGSGHSHHRHNDDEEDAIVLRPGSRAKVRFEFAKRPEYIRPGMRMLFRDGRVRGVGIITAVPDIEAVS